VSLPPPPPPAFDVDAAARRNFRLVVWNGVLFNVGETFIEAATILALFISGLSHSSGVVGLAVALLEVGWYLPQILTIAFVESRRRRLPLYRAMAYVRVAGLVSGFRPRRSDGRAGRLGPARGTGTPALTVEEGEAPAGAGIPGPDAPGQPTTRAGPRLMPIETAGRLRRAVAIALRATPDTSAPSPERADATR